MTGAVVSYERISRFRVTVGNADATVTRGVDRQAIDSRKAADVFDLGEIARHFTDNNRSASEFRTREREEFEEMLEWVNDGRVSVILIWLLDRVVRTTEDLDRLLNACRAHGVRILQTASGVWIDAGNPESRLHAKISGAVAEYEAAKLSMRLRRMHEAKAQSGQWHGGRRRFGFVAGMAAHEPGEAEIVREVARRIIRGETLHALAKDLRARDIRTVSGGYFESGNLGTLFRKGSHLAAMRTHNGAIVRDASGAPVVAAWKPILTRDEWETVCAVLNNPARRSKVHTTARQYLMAGLIVCGVCRAGMRSSISKRTGTAYRCPSDHVYRAMSGVDARVAHYVAAYSEREQIDIRTPRFIDGEDLQGEADAIHERLRVAAEDRALGVYTREAYVAADARLRVELAAIEARRVKRTQPAAVLAPLLAADDYDAAHALFVAAPLDVRREIVRQVMAATGGTFVAYKAPHKGAAFDSRLIVLESDGGDAGEAIA